MSFIVKLVKQLAKADSEKMSFQQPFKPKNRIGIFYVFRQIISQKRFTFTKPAITIFRKRTRNIKKDRHHENVKIEKAHVYKSNQLNKQVKDHKQFYRFVIEF